MNAETFIAENVNMHRGGYRPEEVAELIRRAWREGRQEGYFEVHGKVADAMRLSALGKGDKDDR